MSVAVPPIVIGLVLAVYLVAVVGVVIVIGQDGETNWFEGLQLLSVYAILAVFIFFLPGG